MLLQYPHHASARGDYPVYRGTRLDKRTFETVTEQKLTRPQSPPTRYLELQHLEATFPAVHDDSPVFGGYTTRLRRHCRTIEDRRTPDLDRTIDAGMERPGTDVRGQGPDLVVHLPNVPAPSYDLVLIRKLRSISSIPTVLVDERQDILLEKIQTLNYSFSPGSGQNVGKFSRVHFRWNSDGALECHGACIQAFVHANDGYAGLGLPGHNGAFHGGCATVFRQE